MTDGTLYNFIEQISDTLQEKTHMCRETCPENYPFKLGILFNAMSNTETGMDAINGTNPSPQPSS